jgi:hypothetical protein
LAEKDLLSKNGKKYENPEVQPPSILKPKTPPASFTSENAAVTSGDTSAASSTGA